MTQPPNLEDVSDSVQIADAANSGERRRVSRLTLTSEQFRLHPVGRVFPLIDLSMTGMAIRILDPQDFYLFTVGRKIEGIINLKREKHPITAEVKFVGRETVGIQFKDLVPATRAAMAAFLDPVQLGVELRPIPSVDGNPLWYHGPAGTDLLLWRATDGNFWKLLVYLPGGAEGGSFVQWDDDKLSTGHTQTSREPSETRGALRFESWLLQADSSPDSAKLAIAKQLIMSSNLPQDLKGWCARKLTV